MVEKNYKVRLLPLFEWYLTKITDYIAYNLNNPQGANLLEDEVEKAISERLVCPESFNHFALLKTENIYITAFT